MGLPAFYPPRGGVSPRVRIGRENAALCVAIVRLRARRQSPRARPLQVARAHRAHARPARPLRRASATLRRARRGWRIRRIGTHAPGSKRPSAVSIGRVHRPCPSAVSIGGLGAAPKRNGARRTPFIACGRNVRPMTRGKPPLARRRAPSVAEAARAEPQSEARGTTTRAASQRGRVAPRPLRSESRRTYFFSGSLPGGVAGLNGNELNMVFAWFCICSCICTNMFFDCSM
ncbi:hypothetical protein X942_2758 [Burkholderia pseudomallei MSHR5596]|nr:hypothetical protein X942_2758 [Burkholderia pseudomallei MSHR5596]